MIKIAWGHYSIGSKGGVNTVIKRNIENLLALYNDLEITLFGKLTEDIDNFMDMKALNIKKIDLPIFHPENCKVRGLPIKDQDYHDYRWMGAQIEKVLIKNFKNYDIIFFENTTVGNNPAVIFAFYLNTQGALSYEPKKRFIFRTHDFLFDRPSNFENMKKIRAHRNDIITDWHPITFPNFPNVHYITINTLDALRLYSHGIQPEKIHYLPNSVDTKIHYNDNKHLELRQLLEQKGLVGKDEKIILYPIRIAPRKNVEEAIMWLQVFNLLARSTRVREKFRTSGRYRLIVSLDTQSARFKPYSEQLKRFIEKKRLPVTIDVGEYVSLEREYDKDGNIKRYSIVDLYRISEFVITTSILEGFGMVFIEPWIVEKPVIGRNLPVTKDFREAGMKLGYLYNSLNVKGTDFPKYGNKNSKEIIYVESNEYDPEGVKKRLEFIEELEEEKNLIKFTEDNYIAVNSTLSMLRASHNYISHNKEIVEQEFSNENVARKLYNIIKDVQKS